MYKRLPHGPHRLARDEVVLHQRRRIHGGMIEAVAQSGYERTSVKQVIALAGVSRRSFYELFANKEACFLTTFDLIADRDIRRVTDAYRGAGGPIEERLGATFAKFVEQGSASRKATLLVLVEAQKAGPAATLRLRRATATCEQLLARCFAESPDASALPTPIVRCMIGGLHGALASRLGSSPSTRDDGLAEQMLSWTLLFQSPTVEAMADRLGRRLTRRMRQISLASAHRRVEDPAGPDQDERARLLEHALRLAALHDYRELTGPQIADEAHVSIDTFLELFADRDECFLAALDMIGAELRGMAAVASTSADWPQAVRSAVAAIMSRVAERPVYARTIAQEAFFAGAGAVERNLALTRDIAVLLTEGAPAPARCEVAIDAIAGAFLQVLRCQVMAGRIQLLAALSDYFAYVVLAPFIGAEAAADALAVDAPS